MKRRKIRRADGKIVEAIQGPDGHWYVHDDQVGDWVDDVKQIFMPIPTALEKGARAASGGGDGSMMKLLLVVVILYAVSKGKRR